MLVSVYAVALATPAFPPFAERERPTRLDDRWPSNTPVRVCAIRVEFAPDTLTGTTGNGTFGSGFPDTLKIDPLPHDREYFADHLSFLEHYFVTASRGVLTFSALDIFPAGDVAAYRLAYPMWHYNYNSDTALLNDRLVELFAESANLAAADVNFTQYDAILLFHAGVGKDFNVGNDATPFDIPSAYVSSSDLATYSGSVPPGVTRGLILPESQNQTEVLEFGVELSLNGVMIKLFGNWLGMPDLYNTETGASGIGRWGMMDQGSGNVNAIVPAFPDAWSRIFMGWEEPLVVYPSGDGDTVHIGRYLNDEVTRIVKIPVSGNEYYLLEHRDADADSVQYVSVFDRQGKEMRVDRDGDLAIEEGFDVAIRASHYDYGIPGSGILIWHINEKVIAENIDANRVNADIENRGVDLVEADGSQDIGREYGFATSGSGTELGIQEDCWYRDNRAFRAANGESVFVRFNDNTRPSARLSDHAYTFLEISDFSDVESVMSCRIRGTLVDEGFPVVVADTNACWAAADLDGDGTSEIYVQSHDTLYSVKDSTGLEYVIELPAQSQLLANRNPVDSFTQTALMFGGLPLGIVRIADGVVDTAFHDTFGTISQTSAVSAYLSVDATTDEHGFLFSGTGSDDGAPVTFAALYDSMFTLKSILGRFQAESEIHFMNLQPEPASQFLIWDNHSADAIDVLNDSLVIRWTYVFDDAPGDPIVIIEQNRHTVYFPNVGYIDAIIGQLLCANPDCLPPQIDWDGDGRADGGGADGADRTPREDFALPKTAPNEYYDLNFDGEPDVLQTILLKDDAGSTFGQELIAYDHQTKRYPDFPLAIGGVPNILRLNESEFRYHVLTKSVEDERAVLNLMRLPLSPDGASEEAYFAPDNIIIIGPARPQVHVRDEFVYCWPNPTAGVSNIRVTLPYAAQADVKIFDLVGRKVAELSGSSSAAGAFEIPWDTSELQSGVYIGRVETNGGGQTQSVEIKIAVVR